MFERKITARAFIKAAGNNDLSTVNRYLNENRFNSNAVNASIENGMNALMMAVKFNHLTIVMELLKRTSINVNAADHDGNTPLLYAAAHGRFDIALVLLNVPGIIVNSINQDGFTPLSKAAMQGHDNIVTALLRTRDINLSIINIFNRTAAQEAQAHGQHDIATKLEAAEIAHKLKKQTGRLDYNALICPFSKVRMQDPITISTTGVTCDRTALRNFFAIHNNPDSITCPFTLKPIYRKELENATNITVQRHLFAAAHQDSIEDADEYWYESATTCTIC